MPQILQIELISREEAARRQRKTYYTGLACRHGHLSPRYVTTGACLSCLTKYKRVAAVDPYSEHVTPLQIEGLWVDKRLTPAEALGVASYLQQCLNAYCDDLTSQRGLAPPLRSSAEVVAAVRASVPVAPPSAVAVPVWEPPAPVVPKPKRPPAPVMKTDNVEFAARWVFGKQYMSNTVLTDDAGAAHRLWWPVDRCPVEELLVADSGGPDAETRQVFTDDVARLCVHPWVLQGGRWFVCEDINYGLWPVIREEHASLVLMKFNEEGRGF